MISAPTNWNTLWANPSALLDILITVKLNADISATFDNSDLVSCDMQGALFSDVSIGNACSCSLSIVIKEGEADYYTFQKDQEIKLSCRLRLDSTTTDYVPQGTYYIDSVELKENGDIKIVAYDSIMRTAEYVSQVFGSSSCTFSAYLDRLSTMYDSMFDYSVLTAQPAAHQSSYSSTVGNTKINAHDSELAAFTPLRDILASVAGYAGGNIALDKSGKAHLFRFDDGPTVTTTPLGEVFTAASLKRSQNKLFNNIRTEYESPSSSVGRVKRDGSGYNVKMYANGKALIQGAYFDYNVLTYNLNLGTTSKQLQSARIQTGGAYISPLVELGDVVSLDIGGGEYLNYILSEYKLSLVGGCWGEINIPMSDNSVNFAYGTTWNSSSGWISGFNNGTTTREAISITFESCNRLTFKHHGWTQSLATNIIVVLARIYDLSATTLTISTTYLDADGVSQNLNLTGYISNFIYPVKTISGSDREFTVDVVTSGIPEIAVGQTRSATFNGKTSISPNTYYTSDFQVKVQYKPSTQ